MENIKTTPEVEVEAVALVAPVAPAQPAVPAPGTPEFAAWAWENRGV